MKKISFGIFLFVQSLSFLKAAEHWDIYPANAVPWAEAKAIVSFNNEIYVSGTKPQSPDVLWGSTDGVTWTLKSFPAPLFSPSRNIECFSELNGQLYAFLVEFSTGPSGIGFLFSYRSTDGQNWERVDGNVFGVGGPFSNSIVFQGNIYVGNLGGKIWKSSISNNVVSWTLVSPAFSNPDAKRTVSFGVFQNKLYAAFALETLFETGTEIYETINGTQWSLTTQQPPSQEIFRPGAVEYLGGLYWGANFLEKYTGINSSPAWEEIVAGVLPVPFILNNQLHVVGPSSQILAMNSDESWSVVEQNIPPFCATNVPKYGQSATLGNTTFLLPCDLIKIKKGVHTLNNESFVGLTLAPLQNDVLSLKWEKNVNFEDFLKNILVINLGTAQPEVDILGLSLYKETVGSGQSTKMGDLVYDSGSNAWTFPVLQNISVVDGDILSIKVSISQNPTLGATIQLSVPSNGFSFDINPGFQLSSPLVATQAHTINIPAAPVLAPIEKVVVYPNPGKDLIRFAYTLSSLSDVKILIFDQSGRQVKEIMEHNKTSGERVTTLWDTKDIPSGIYFAIVKISNENGHRSHKIKIAIEK